MESPDTTDASPRKERIGWLLSAEELDQMKAAMAHCPDAEVHSLGQWIAWAIAAHNCRSRYERRRIAELLDELGIERADGVKRTMRSWPIPLDLSSHARAMARMDYGTSTDETLNMYALEAVRAALRPGLNPHIPTLR